MRQKRKLGKSALWLSRGSLSYLPFLCYSVSLCLFFVQCPAILAALYRRKRKTTSTPFTRSVHLARIEAFFFFFSFSDGTRDWTQGLALDRLFNLSHALPQSFCFQIESHALAWLASAGNLPTSASQQTGIKLGATTWFICWDRVSITFYPGWPQTMIPLSLPPEELWFLQEITPCPRTVFKVRLSPKSIHQTSN
jgi:hypothetical protein